MLPDIKMMNVRAECVCADGRLSAAPNILLKEVKTPTEDWHFEHISIMHFQLAKFSQRAQICFIFAINI